MPLNRFTTKHLVKNKVVIWKLWELVNVKWLKFVICVKPRGDKMDPERKVNTKKLTKSEIKDLLVKYGLETEGNKDVLKKRLKEYYEAQEMEEEDDAQDDYLSVQDEIKPDDTDNMSDVFV